MLIGQNNYLPTPIKNFFSPPPFHRLRGGPFLFFFSCLKKNDVSYNRKRMTMKQLKKLILLSLVPVLTTGCIKEDMDDCENVAICFRYKADGDKDVLRQYMDKIDLYVSMPTTVLSTKGHTIRTP